MLPASRQEDFLFEVSAFNKERRIKCELPNDTVFKTKPELAAEMSDDLASGSNSEENKK